MTTIAANADAATNHGAHAHHDDHADHVPGFFVRWFMSTNHKDIGILYLFAGGLVGLISVIFTVYMRMELMEPGVQYMCQEGARFIASADACTSSAAPGSISTLGIRTSRSRSARTEGRTRSSAARPTSTSASSFTMACSRCAVTAIRTWPSAGRA